MRLPRLSTLLLLALLATTAKAQVVVARDHIVALPPVSICQDGATHQTVITRHRLRPNNFNLNALVGKAVEIAGNSRTITCTYIDLTSVKALAADQSSVTSRPSRATLQVDFFGTAPTGTLYMLYLSVGVANTPLLINGIGGPIHLDLNAYLRVPGTFLPAGASTPYASVVFQLVPNVLGIDFYSQAVAVNANQAEMTNVDTFRW
jgi:hypothetical protein